MSKARKKTTTVKSGKVPASFVDKNAENKKASENDSKYQPTSEALSSTQTLDPRDQVVKLFIDSIRDLYWAENHLVKALPKMINASTSEALQQAISKHLEQTKGHVTRLEKIFKLLSVNPQAKKCDAMEGLTKEGEAVVECTDPGTAARDFGIIMASQKVEHYEIASYTGLSNLAQILDLGEIGQILSDTLTEEQQADNSLAKVADEIEITE